VNARLPRLRERWGALLFVWLFQLGAAVLIAAPIVGVIAGTGVTAHPRGDRVLFEPGGVLLVETLRRGAGPLLGALRASGIELLVLGVVGSVPLAALLLALASRDRLRLESWLGGAIAHFPGFLLIGGAGWIARAVIVLLALLLSGGLGPGLESALGERGGDLALLVGAMFVVVLLTAVGIAADLARAAAVRTQGHALPSMLSGLRALASRPLAAAVSWLTPAVWSVAVVAVAALAVGALRVELAGSWRFVVALLAHQLAVLALLALRAAWLKSALELVGPPLADR
jgi:hypothetical protein